MASFDDWLRWLKSAQKGPVTLYASRGRVFAATVTINADYTGASMRGEVRLGPDAAGIPEATFTVSAPAVVSGVTTFDVTMTAAAVDGLPAATAGDGLAQFAFDLLLTPSGGDEELLFGGTFSVGGRITE